jgi:hypothetical protein
MHLRIHYCHQKLPAPPGVYRCLSRRSQNARTFESLANELIPIAVGHLNRLVTPFDNPMVTTTSQATTSSKGKIVCVATTA